MSLLQERSIDFKISFNIFTRFELKALIRLNIICVHHYMHITISIELFKASIISVLANFQHKSKT